MHHIGFQSSKKSKSGRSLNEDNGEDHADNKKKGTFFSWTRNKSFGKGTKKRENGFLAGNCKHNYKWILNFTVDFLVKVKW